MLNVGLDFRYQHVFSASDIAHSYNNLYDLTRDPRLIGVPLVRVIGGKNPSYPIPGASGYYGTPRRPYASPSGGIINNGNGEPNDSWAYDSAALLGDRVSLTRQLSLLLGSRGDLLHVDLID